MDANTQAAKDLWKWAGENIRPGSCWRFAGPNQVDGAVILCVLDLHWRTPENHYEIEFAGMLVEGPDGQMVNSLPDGPAPLPEWFNEFQRSTDNTSYFMVTPVFKEQMDAGRITRIEAPGL